MQHNFLYKLNITHIYTKFHLNFEQILNNFALYYFKLNLGLGIF
jgi:hypothetical protein